MARIAWKLMVTGNSYAAKSAPAALMGRDTGATHLQPR
jgi:hypothetical protein